MTIQSTVLLEESEILALLRERDKPWAAPVADWKVETGEDSLDSPAAGSGSSLKPSRSLSNGMQSVNRCGSGLPKQETITGSMYDSGQKRSKMTWMPWGARKRLRNLRRRQCEPC